MNAITSIVLWISAQVALFSMIGCAAYLLLRWRGPQTAATGAAIGLAATLVLSVLVISPWPKWSIGAGGGTVGSTGTASGTHSSTGKAMDNTWSSSDARASTGGAGGTEDALSQWWQNTVTWIWSGNGAAGQQIAERPVWFSWIGIVLGAGMLFGLLRLGAGLWGVSQLRRNSRRIEDESLQAEVGGLVTEIGGVASISDRVNIEARECSLLRSAATIGWRRPLLLLPAGWRNWNETQRRAVLAHELAHAARRDYLTGMIARVAAAIHFYQPLVLWLARQLRIEQELAADGAAADAVGNRQTYLETLAQMALRADEQARPWGARAFLPGTSMLVRRVKWLRSKSPRVEKSLSRSARWILAGGMIAVALAVAGVRGPSEMGTNTAVAAEPEPSKPQPKDWTWDVSSQAKELRTYEYIPADAKAVIVVSPSAISSSPGVGKLVTEFDTIRGFEKTFGLKLSEIADAKFVMTQLGPNFERTIIQSTTPHNWKSTLGKNFPAMKGNQLDGKEYFSMDPVNVANTDGFGPCFYVADDRTVIGGTEEQIKKIIAGGEKLMDEKTFPGMTTVQFAAWTDVDDYRRQMKAVGAHWGTDGVFATVEPLLDQAKNATFLASAFVNPGTKQEEAYLVLFLNCNSTGDAARAAQTINALVTLGKNFLVTLGKQIDAAVKEDRVLSGVEATKATTKALLLASTALENTKIDANTKSSMVVVNSSFPLPEEIATTFLLPELRGSREAAMRVQTMNNLKQWALGMLMYASANNGHLPPPAIYGKDGKALLSRRVALLPYMEQEALYKEFHLDEPWDSEHNKTLIEKMPPFLRDPHEPENSTNASYFMPTGKGTIGGNKDGVKVQNITDGTPNTIMLVEAKRDIPWTKPEDIEIDPDESKPLPKFGGHMPVGFAATFCDGHVEKLEDSLDPKMLHAMFTIAGGEPVDRGALNPPRQPPDLKPVPAVK